MRRTFEKQIVENVELRSVRQLGFVNAEGIAKKIIARFEAGEFDVCTLFYSRFKSVIAQVPTAQQIIPLVVETTAANAGPATSYEYEPEEDEILPRLLPRNLAVQIFRALLENNASFYGSQMSAMDNATRNAGDMIRKQTLIYNRTRQAMITKELVEIIPGAEALVLAACQQEATHGLCDISDHQGRTQRTRDAGQWRARARDGRAEGNRRRRRRA